MSHSFRVRARTAGHELVRHTLTNWSKCDRASWQSWLSTASARCRLPLLSALIVLVEAWDQFVDVLLDPGACDPDQPSLHVVQELPGLSLHRPWIASRGSGAYSSRRPRPG